MTAFKDLFLQGYLFKPNQKLSVFQRNPVIIGKQENFNKEEIV